MKILMIGSFPTTTGGVNGGVAAATTYLSSALLKHQNVNVTGISLESNARSVTTDVYQGITIYRLPVGSRNVLSNFKSSIQLARIIAEDTGPDLVHAQGLDLAGLIACNIQLPKIITIHGVLHRDAQFQNTALRRLRETIFARRFTRAGFGGCDHFISISPYVRKIYRKRLWNKSVYDIPNTIAEDFYSWERCVEPGRILFLGRVSRRKGFGDLVEALGSASLGKVSLRVAGAIADKKYKDAIDIRAQKLNLHRKITYLGLLDEVQVLDELSKASCLVLPSHQETAPMVIQQALAMGCPVIASNICGIPYQLGHGKFGTLFPVGNRHQLSKNIMEVMNNGHDQAVIKADAGRLSAQVSFVPSKVAELTFNSYLKVLNT